MRHTPACQAREDFLTFFRLASRTSRAVNREKEPTATFFQGQTVFGKNKDSLSLHGVSLKWVTPSIDNRCYKDTMRFQKIELDI